ncbi:MAG: hypothetical protein E6F99_23165 [Actinobacteria bacterium]|nr:MAG: hypothetical protein E6F99_23165 [Actinomycetota bacterium]
MSSGEGVFMVQDAVRPRRNRRRQRIVLVVFLVLVLGFFGFVWFATRHSASYAKVGDCVTQTGANSVKIVKCDDPSATFKVVGRVDDKTEVDASIDACDSYASQGAVSVYWQGTSGGKGMVLCLAKNR